MPVFPIHAPLDSEGYFDLAPTDLRHLQKVLRMGTGDRFQVVFADGRAAEACLEVQRKKTRGRWLQWIELEAAPLLPLRLGIGLLRWSRLEWLVEKCTELGVAELCLLRLRQGRLAKSDEISPNKIKRLQTISQETLKQCERITSTRIEGPMRLEDFLRSPPGPAGNRQRLILRERLNKPRLRETLRREVAGYEFLVGPEGGFHVEELTAAHAAGFEDASLGPQVLRSETAALAAAAALEFFRGGERGPA